MPTEPTPSTDAEAFASLLPTLVQMLGDLHALLAQAAQRAQHIQDILDLLGEE
jgi:hypothetical protein